MYRYNDLYQIGDKIIALLEKQQRLSDELLYSSFPHSDLPKVLSAIKELTEQNYICKHTDNLRTSSYILASKGSDVYDKGGFKHYFDELNRKKEIKELIDQSVLLTNQSVIDTNKIVQKNAITQERLTVFALIIAAVAAFVPVITLVKELVRPTQLIDTETKQIMKDQQKSIDSLAQNLKTVRDTLKNQKNFSYSKDSTKTK